MQFTYQFPESVLPLGNSRYLSRPCLFLQQPFPAMHLYFAANASILLDSGRYEIIDQPNIEKSSLPGRHSALRIPDLICRVNHALEHSAETQLKQHSLTIEQFRVLTALNESNGISMGALAVGVCMDSPTLTKLIDRMVASADVYRGPDPRDRRKVLVFISNKGLTTYEALSDIHNQQRDTLSAALGSQNLEMLESLLTHTLQAVSGADAQRTTPLQPGSQTASKTHRLS